METGAVGVLAAELMDRLEVDYADKQGVEFGVCAVVVEVSWEEGDTTTFSSVEYRCTDGRRWIQHGLFAAAGRAVDAGPIGGEDEDDDG